MATDVRDDCEALAVALANAKRDEAQAKAARIEAEEKLAEALGGKERGSSSFSCGCLKVTVKRGFNYALRDKEEFERLFPEYTKVVHEVKLNEKVYEDAREVNAESFLAASQFVTATPKKVAVEIKM